MEYQNSNLIKFCSDLSFGHLTKYNRKVKEKNVENIYKGLKDDDSWNLLGMLIIDKDTNAILDGQHRYLALKRYVENFGSLKNRDIIIYMYERQPGETISDAIKKLNKNRNNFTKSDEIKCSAEENNPAAKLLIDFASSHRLTTKLTKKGKISNYNYRYASSILFGYDITSNESYKLIKVNDELVKRGEVMYNEIEQLFDAMGLNIGSWFEQFVQAWVLVRSNVGVLDDKTFKKIKFKDYIKEFCSNTENLRTDFNNKNIWVERFNNTYKTLID